MAAILFEMRVPIRFTNPDQGTARLKTRSTPCLRASFNFPYGIDQNLQELATQKKASLPWFVQEAGERYVAEAKVEVRKEPGQTVRTSK